MKYDCLIVGAGLFGATFARQMLDDGKSVLVIDRRSHIGGNCYTEKQNLIDVHMYGPHIFHTNSLFIWQYVNKYTKFNGYHHQVIANTENLGKISLPINLHTLNTLFGIKTPLQAKNYFNSVKDISYTGNTIEDWCIRTIGRELYECLIYGYTKKQWGREPNTLPMSIIKRLPIRLDWNNRYNSDIYEGIPVNGYTDMIHNMLDGANVILNVDYIQNKKYFNSFAHNIVYTGALDELYNYNEGKLEYRSIKHEHRLIQEEDYQGISQMNYTGLNVPYTRVIEHKHFNYVNLPHTIISTEYSTDQGENAYPIRDDKNSKLSDIYIKQAKNDGYIIGGRLAEYRYMDMAPTIARAIKLAENYI